MEMEACVTSAADHSVEAWGGAASDIVASETAKTETMKVLNTDVANHTISESARAASGAIASLEAVAAAAARAASAIKRSLPTRQSSSYGGGGSRVAEYLGQRRPPRWFQRRDKDKASCRPARFWIGTFTDASMIAGAGLDV